MSDELKERIEQLISYYNAHSMEAFIDGDDQRLKHFVTDDFSHLLTALEKEL
jgi:hypothetical protein